MKSIQVQDCSFDRLRESYDLVIYASGYERRCTHIAGIISPEVFSRHLILGFAGMSESPQRKLNEQFFDQKWSEERTILNAADASAMLEQLNEWYGSGRRKRLRILVDYSSMSRVWYSTILAWARYRENIAEIELDFLYSIGIYNDSPMPIRIESMLPLPGLEGGALRLGRSVAVFGLGFYGLMTQCVLEHLGPDIVYAYLASPGASPSYPERVREENRFLIDDAEATIEVPLFSVSSAMRLVSEMVIPHLSDAEIVVVPMGPKPHALAATLVSMRFPEVACLRVSATRRTPEDVPADGRVVVTRITVQTSAFSAESNRKAKAGVRDTHSD